jgi:hypothetical protein
MQTLAQLQARMAGADQADAMAAAIELTNYLLIYNDEYNTLIVKRQDARAAEQAASVNPAGVDHAEVLRLQSLILGIESRMAVQDARLIAFQASSLAINPPDANQVQQVKSLTTQVAAMIARDQGIESIMVALGQIAGVVNQIQGG